MTARCRPTVAADRRDVWRSVGSQRRGRWSSEPSDSEAPGRGLGHCAPSRLRHFFRGGYELRWSLTRGSECDGGVLDGRGLRVRRCLTRRSQAWSRTRCQRRGHVCRAGGYRRPTRRWSRTRCQRRGHVLAPRLTRPGGALDAGREREHVDHDVARRCQRSDARQAGRSARPSRPGRGQGPRPRPGVHRRSLDLPSIPPAPAHCSSLEPWQLVVLVAPKSEKTVPPLRTNPPGTGRLFRLQICVCSTVRSFRRHHVKHATPHERCSTSEASFASRYSGLRSQPIQRRAATTSLAGISNGTLVPDSREPILRTLPLRTTGIHARFR